MSGAKSRRKGAAWERELVHKFRDAMPGADVKRGLQSRSGSDAADVECPVFWVEAKRGQKPSPRSALQQAVEASPEDRVPIAVIRDDRRPAFVVISLENFLEFISEWWATRDSG